MGAQEFRLSKVLHAIRTLTLFWSVIKTQVLNFCIHSFFLRVKICINVKLLAKTINLCTACGLKIDL